MRPLSIYVDSSVWNAAFDDHVEEMRSMTQLFLDRVKETGDVAAYISDVVLAELARAPAKRAGELAELIRQLSPFRLDLEEESASLAEAYIEHGVVTKGHLVDARHVAIATVARIQVLVSWNYRHLVNRRRREAFNGVNSIEGYPPIEIISPPEVFDE